MPRRSSTSVEENPVSTSQSNDIIKSMTCLSLLDPIMQHGVVHPLSKQKSRKSKIPTRSTSTLAGRRATRGPSLERRSSDSLPFPLRKVSIEAQQADTKPALEDDHGSPSRTRRAIRRYGYFTPPASPHRETQDRFVPARKSPDSAIETFCLSKPTQHLTKEERFLRTSSASPDPFSPRSPRHFHDPSRLSLPGNFPRNRGVLSTNIRPNTNSALPTRHVSAGTVWNIGGNAAAEPNHPVNAIPNGRGGLLGSGTNAPMFSSHFFEGETPDESTERFEGRLATALEIDQTNRMLEISQSPLRGKRSGLPRGNTAPGRLSNSPRTRWEYGRWVNDRMVSCKSDWNTTLLNQHSSPSITFDKPLSNRNTVLGPLLLLILYTSVGCWGPTTTLDYEPEESIFRDPV